jgi:regulator of RNase E activity RraA
MSNQHEIIDYIETNRVSTTEVADCLGKTGCVEGVSAVNRGHFHVGKVHWVYAYGETNWHVHEQIRYVDPGSIVVISVFDCNGRAIIGDIVAKYLLLYKKAKAIVIQGPARDANRLIKENWPVWCEGFNPVGCFNTNLDVPEIAELSSARDYYSNAIAVCDDTGVVIIPEEIQEAELLEKLRYIEEQEDIWYDCIDRLKWDTYETICLKNYQKN